jgi:RNA polymerase sigma-70 factor (ECF subfamily)
MVITDEVRLVNKADAFADWYAGVEPRLRAALVARFGPEVGRDAAAAALAWAWEHWGRLAEVDNPVGYLYRVGQSRTRRRKQGWTAVETPPADAPFEPGLPAALALLSGRQRSVVILVNAYGWSLAETAAVLGITKSSVQTHLERGMASLRQSLGVTP